MDLFRRLSLPLLLALATLLVLPLLFSLVTPALVSAPASLPEPVHDVLIRLEIEDELGAAFADLGLFSPGKVCAAGNCLALYCDRIINGQCHKRNGDGSYSLPPIPSVAQETVRGVAARAVAAPVLMVKATAAAPNPVLAAAEDIYKGYAAVIAAAAVPAPHPLLHRRPRHPPAMASAST